MRWTRLFCLASLLCSGCIRTTVVQFWEPAEVDVSHMNRIVVLEFSGEHGPAVATSLSGRLWQNEFYTVVDRTELSQELQLANFVKGKSSHLSDVLIPARARGIDGVLLGEVLEYHCEDERVRKSSAATANGGGLLAARRKNANGGGLEMRDVILREGTVTVAFRLIDVQTGDVRASRKVTHHYSGEIDSDMADAPSSSDVLDDLTQQCLSDIVEMLAPHEESSEIQLATCDVWTRGRREVKAGLLAAGQGDWETAEREWTAALAVEPQNHAALYNLSVVADHKHDYARAEELAMQAIRLEHKQCYALGLDTIRRHRSAAEKSAEQRDARVASTIDEVWK